MWVTTLTIVTLAAMLVALAHIARSTRRLDARLGALGEEQRERRGCMEKELERVRQEAAELEVVVTAAPGC